eukprot:scaffold138389_cov48-Prasinocladus_malaysianus.AAC.1
MEAHVRYDNLEIAQAYIQIAYKDMRAVHIRVLKADGIQNRYKCHLTQHRYKDALVNCNIKASGLTSVHPNSRITHIMQMSSISFAI